MPITKTIKLMTTIKLSTRIKMALALWCVCEMLAFSLAVHWIGVTDAILLGMITSLIGFSMLRRAGASALMKLRTGLGARRPGSAPPLIDETLATVGAAALLLPGFLSDIVGLALAVPTLRSALAGRIGRRGLGVMRARGGRGQNAPATIDLAPEEWRQADPVTRAMPKG